jgi:PAS domain S-box-containing protein
MRSPVSILRARLAGHSVGSVNGPGDKDFLNHIETRIRSRVPGPITIYDEYLVYKFDGNGFGQLESEAETLRRIYAGVKLDVVIAVAPQAVRLAEQYRDKIFPGTPILFAQISSGEPEAQPRAGVTGLISAAGISETIDLALRLHPDTQTVALISGPDPYWFNVSRSELSRRQGRVEQVDFVEPPSRELLEKISALPAHTIVLFQLSPDSSRPEFGGWDLLDAVAKRWPTYSAWPTLCLNHGCVGGSYGTDFSRDATETGEMAARILLGTRPEDVPLEHSTDLRPQVDWRALQYWHIPESALPAGTIILYREPTLFERDRKFILPAIALILAQGLLIGGLLWQRARKRKAEAVLRESEERFRVMADTAPSLIWMCDVQGEIIYLNEQWLAFSGSEPDSAYGYTWIESIHPEDVQRVLEALWQAIKDQRSFSSEYRLRRADGVFRWMFNVASPRVNGDGSFVGFIGSAVDVTDQKLAQMALEKVSGQLIEAQEKERNRIARELHDDICQRLSVLSMEIERAKRDSGGRVSATKNLEEIRQHCSEISDDVQSLSHRLHSSALDLLGIVAALRGFCRELSKQHGVTIDFSDREVPGHLPKDISLCLFRVAQESLHNAVKYSGTDHYKMQLSATVCEVRLEVTDTGAGFEVEGGKRGRGLGLVSMQERVHLVHGKFTIESKCGVGTMILAVVPLPADDGSRESAGTGKADALEVG